MSKFTILFVTGSRAEYGIMKPLLSKLNSIEEVDLNLVVTGTHLEEKYGFTMARIQEDGFKIIEKIPLNLINTDTVTVGNSLGILSMKLNEVFNSTKFDLVLILGDRYEMLPVANLAVLYKVPICHLHGGELTFGNYDEHFRHALTKMSSLHLTSTESYRQRVISLGENPNAVFNIGAIGVENAMSSLHSRNYILTKFNLKPNQEYYVVLYHPVTLSTFDEMYQESKSIIEFIRSTEKNIFIIGNNADSGADIFRNEVSKFVDNTRVFEISSLDVKTFHSLVKYSIALIGNSSSGLIEVPSLEVPTINVGSRQRGREYGSSVINVEGNYSSIIEGINKSDSITSFFNPYFKENSVDNAISIIMEKLNNKLDSKKIFYEGGIQNE